MSIELKDINLKELERMCGNLVDLAAEAVLDQAECITTEDEKRRVWWNDRDIRVVGNLVAHAALLYRSLLTIQVKSPDIQELLEKVAPDLGALPEIDPGNCDRCDAELTSDDMINLKCHNCGTSLKEERSTMLETD